MVSAIISRLVILVFGTLYPAYASYKAVKTKNVKEYVKWMMYWIVFAFFTCAETFSDIFLAWIPFYYELKMIFVIWLLSPATKGASILYRKFVHPQLAKREKDIDAYINKASDQGYTALLSLGSKGFNYATNVVLATAIKIYAKGQSKIVDQLKKSYSMNDLTPESLAQPRRPLSLEDSNIDDETAIEQNKKSPPTKRKAPLPPQQTEQLDNRILEENYQQEMMELEDADREKEYKRSLSSGLSRVEETEEENIQTRSASNKNRYSSKEESYYTTYYRGTSSTTPTSTWQTSTSTSPTSWRSTYSSYYK